MGMRNTLPDLNNYLFEELERLNDDDLSAEELDKEIKKSKAIEGIAQTIIKNGELALKATKYADEMGYNKGGGQLPFYLTGEGVSEEVHAGRKRVSKKNNT